jgi:hypothetical protein
MSARKPNTGDAAVASDHLPVETIMDLIMPQTGAGEGASAAGALSLKRVLTIKNHGSGIVMEYAINAMDSRGRQAPMLCVYDCSGRVLFIARPASLFGRIFWDRRGPEGNRAPAGLYIAKLSNGGDATVTSAVLR